ncbi:MAG: hypothetical protein ACJ0SM_05115 [Arenicellales bacterium]
MKFEQRDHQIRLPAADHREVLVEISLTMCTIMMLFDSSRAAAHADGTAVIPNRDRVDFERDTGSLH